MTLRDLQERGYMNGNKGPKVKILKVRYEPSQPELDRIHFEKLKALQIKGLKLLTPAERKRYE